MRPHDIIGPGDKYPSLDKFFDKRGSETEEASTSHTDPPHYKQLNPEPWDVIDAWDLPRWRAFALKYIARAGAKPGCSELDDIIKARNYLDREIKRLKSKPQPDNLAEMVIEDVKVDQVETTNSHATAISSRS